MATESAGILSVAVTGDISALLTALDQATSAATAAGTAIAEALTAPSESSDFNFGTQLADQFQDATSAAETAGSAISDALEEPTNQMDLFAEAADTADTAMEQLSGQYSPPVAASGTNCQDFRFRTRASLYRRIVGSKHSLSGRRPVGRLSGEPLK